MEFLIHDIEGLSKIYLASQKGIFRKYISLSLTYTFWALSISPTSGLGNALHTYFGGHKSQMWDSMKWSKPVFGQLKGANFTWKLVENEGQI